MQLIVSWIPHARSESWLSLSSSDSFLLSHIWLELSDKFKHLAVLSGELKNFQGENTDFKFFYNYFMINCLFDLKVDEIKNFYFVSKFNLLELLHTALIRLAPRVLQ
ncbi:hypothetical protein BpHYR1_036759 [Brachionus plicatilis]|uniref:Uncharacterized protein n=1 Tax=Brachionus plicatilis TaxID=10195 RepID=A0A3M7QK63_BRAPC|nr:hypothetical protein BpHYR1_036759 [Brachionus plicatilis]